MKILFNYERTINCRSRQSQLLGRWPTFTTVKFKVYIKKTDYGVNYVSACLRPKQLYKEWEFFETKDGKCIIELLAKEFGFNEMSVTYNTAQSEKCMEVWTKDQNIERLFDYAKQLIETVNGLIECAFDEKHKRGFYCFDFEPDPEDPETIECTDYSFLPAEKLDAAKPVGKMADATDLF